MKEPGTVNLSWVSERHLRVELGRDTSKRTHLRVRAVYERLRTAGVVGLRDLTPAYATVLLSFDAMTLDAGHAEAQVLRAIQTVPDAHEDSPSRPVEIPVCYEGECAPDIADVAAACGMSVGEVIALHSAAEYYASFVGFVPGFAYLGGLSKRLEMPRLERPRVRVPAGSVGIAGEQTGVYPFATAGGWRLIGRTPLNMFDAHRARPAFLAMGDRVRFVSISAEQFRAMGGS